MTLIGFTLDSEGFIMVSLNLKLLSNKMDMTVRPRKN